VRKEQQRQDEIYERWRLEEMQLRPQSQEVEHRRWREELEQQLRQEAAAVDRAAYLAFVVERAAGIDDGGAAERAGSAATGDRPPLHRVGWPVADFTCHPESRNE
jgi:hypothetical protein